MEDLVTMCERRCRKACNLCSAADDSEETCHSGSNGGQPVHSITTIGGQAMPGQRTLMIHAHIRIPRSHACNQTILQESRRGHRLDSQHISTHHGQIFQTNIQFLVTTRLQPLILNVVNEIIYRVPLRLGEALKLYPEPWLGARKWNLTHCFPQPPLMLQHTLNQVLSSFN